jgi:hypothetical protein
VAVFFVVIFSQGNWFVRKNKPNQDNERASYSSDVDAQRSPPTPGAAKTQVGAGVPHEAPIPLLNTPELSLKPSDTAVEPMAANSQEEPRLSPQEVAMDADAHSEVGRKSRFQNPSNRYAGIHPRGVDSRSHVLRFDQCWTRWPASLVTTHGLLMSRSGSVPRFRASLLTRISALLNAEPLCAQSKWPQRQAL